jgi:hypothetical protein
MFKPIGPWGAIGNYSQIPPMNTPYLALASVTAITAAVSLGPKFSSFNASSGAHAVASTRAESCQLLEQVTPGMRPIYAPTNSGLPLGSPICDGMGNTAIVGADGLVSDIQSGQPEAIRKQLEKRGYKFDPPLSQATK